MYVKDVLVQNQVGLHARPATFFIRRPMSQILHLGGEGRTPRQRQEPAGRAVPGNRGRHQYPYHCGRRDEEAAVDGLVNLVQSGFAE